MITILSGTNRSGGKTKIIAEVVYSEVQKMVTELVKFYSLEELPSDFVHNEMYNPDKMSPALIEQQEEYFIPADKLIILVPEYNGGLPGIFKLFIDAISIRKYADNFKDKKVFLIGVSAGRAGNARGLDYLTNALHYLKMNVFPIKLPISGIGAVIDENGKMNAETIDVLRENLKSFVAF